MLNWAFQKKNKDSAYFGHAAFGSCIDIFKRDNNKFEINFGTTGSFDPNENKVSYWRAIHVGECIKNWIAVCDIVSEFCNKFAELKNEIKEVNIPEEIN